MKAKSALGFGVISTNEFYGLGGEVFDVDTIERIVAALKKTDRSFDPLVVWKDEIERKARDIAATGTCSYEHAKDVIESVVIRSR